jgi:hypothetical protein
MISNGFIVCLLVTLVVPVVPSSASRLEAALLLRGVSSTRTTSREHSSANPAKLKGSLPSSWLGRVLSCASASPASSHAAAGAARRKLQDCSCGPQQAQQVEVEAADSFLISSGSATAAVANTSTSSLDSDRDGIADQLLLMKIKVLPVPASVIQRKLATGKNSCCKSSRVHRYVEAGGQQTVKLLVRSVPANPAAPAHSLRGQHMSMSCAC